MNNLIKIAVKFTAIIITLSLFTPINIISYSQTENVEEKKEIEGQKRIIDSKIDDSLLNNDNSMDIESIGNNSMLSQIKDNKTISNIIDTVKNPDDNTKTIAFLIAASGILGASATIFRRKNSDNKLEEISPSSLASLKQNLELDQGGIWISEKDRDKLINDINSLSARKYKINEKGYIIPDTEKGIDNSKSLEASNLIDSLIYSDKKTILSISNKIDKYDYSSKRVISQKLQDGISIGDDEIGHIVAVSEDVNSPIVIFHELAHAQKGNTSALETENIIRKELGIVERTDVEKHEDDTLFYNNFSEDELLLDDLVKELKFNIAYSPDLNSATVDKGNEKINFKVEEDGILDPAKKKMVVKKKQFRYKMNFDLKENELYLRSEVNRLGEAIDWNDEKRTATFTYKDNAIEIKVGEHGTKIVNDRIVIDKAELQKLLDSQASDTQYNESEENNVEQEEASSGEAYNDESNNQEQKMNNIIDDSELNNALERMKNIVTIDEQSSALLTLGSATGLILNKYRNFIMHGARDKKEIESLKGVVEGIKEALNERKIKINEVLNNENTSNELYNTAGFISRAALIKGSKERELLFGILSDDLIEITSKSEFIDVFLISKEYAKSMSECLLSQSIYGGLSNSLKSLSEIIKSKNEIKLKINKSIRHKYLLDNINLYIENYPERINEIVFKIEDLNDKYELTLWDWDLNIYINKKLIKPYQDAILYKFS